MESHLSEESLWAGALAARLRLLQADFADDDSATRQDCINQEIEHALKGCVPDKQKSLLGALATRFPVWQSSAPVQEAPAPALPSAPETPEALLQRVLEVLPSLPAAQQAGFIGHLKRAGLVAEPSGAEFKVSPDLLKRLGLDASRSFSTDRVAKTLAMLLDTTLALDQLVWTLWKQIAPRSVVRREADFAKLSGEFLAGSNEVSAAQVIQTLERTRKLVASLLGAIGRAGAAYARERARLFDPDAIQASAGPEKKWNESMEFASWRKYVQLCKEYGAEPVIEKGIQEAIARAAENLIMGRPVG
jgi:hypothetical protein